MYLRDVRSLLWLCVQLVLVTLCINASLHGASVTLAWDASATSNITNYSLYYGTASRTYSSRVNVGNVLTGTISNLLEGTKYYFAVTAQDDLSLESDWSEEISYTVNSAGGALRPTLDAISDITVDENSPQQTVNLTGITSGSATESQSLTLTATSSDPSLIPTPLLTYTSPNTEGTLQFTPVANGSGTSTITITVTDSQAAGMTFQRSFVVTVVPANDAPVANAGPDVYITLPFVLTVSGTATDDSLPNPPQRLTTSWSKVSGPGTVLFSSSMSLVSTVSFSVGGQYVLRLTVTDGESAASDDMVVDVADDTAGPVISGQILESLDARSFTMAWQTDEPARCHVEFGTTFGLDSSSPLEPSSTTTHRVTFTNLTESTVYYYRIRSIDEAGNVSVLGPAPVSTPPLTIFAFAAEDGVVTSPMTVDKDDAAMGGQHVVSPIANSGSVRFPVKVSALSTYRLWCRVWSPSAGVGSFAVSVDGGAEDIFDAGQTDWRNGWRWVALNGRDGAAPLTINPRSFLLNLGVHEFSFRALDMPVGLDELILSNDPEWTPEIRGRAPVLSATAVLPDKVRLIWTDSIADEDGFRIEVSDGSGYVELATVPANTSRYDHGGIPAGATLSYRIYGFNDSDRTDYSNVAAASVGQTPP